MCVAATTVQPGSLGFLTRQLKTIDTIYNVDIVKQFDDVAERVRTVSTSREQLLHYRKKRKTGRKTSTNIGLGSGDYYGSNLVTRSGPNGCLDCSVSYVMLATAALTEFAHDDDVAAELVKNDAVAVFLKYNVNLNDSPAHVAACGLIVYLARKAAEKGDLSPLIEIHSHIEEKTEMTLRFCHSLDAKDSLKRDMSLLKILCGLVAETSPKNDTNLPVV